MGLEAYLSPGEIARIETKIGAVERVTSAELRVVITRSSWMGIGNKAARLFRRYHLDRTAGRNGVLLLVDVKNRELLIYGDQGIDEKVGSGFWTGVRDNMLTELREGKLASSLLAGVHEIGEALRTIFPAQPGDRNEIPDALLFEP